MRQKNSKASPGEEEQLLSTQSNYHTLSSDSEQLPFLSDHQLTQPSRINPFYYDSTLSTYERLKIFLMCICLIPVLRILLMLILLVPIVILAVIGTLGHTPAKDIEHDRPLGCCRRIILYPIRYLFRAILFVFGFYYIPVTYPKKPNTVHANVIVANHVTFIDGIFMVAHCFPSVAMKAELGKIPFVGSIVRALDPILIDRTTSAGRKRAIDQIKQRPIAGNFPPLLIFPEGTTSRNDNLTKFKRGPFLSGQPVQPVILRYPYRNFDISWTPLVSPLYLFARMLCQFSNNLEVEYLPVYIPDELEEKNPDLYAENVRRAMATAMQVLYTDHAFEDVMLLVELGQYAEHVVSATSMEEIKKLTSMDAKEINKLVQHFAANDTDKNGKISFDEMKAIMRKENSQFIERLFVLLDANGNGEVDFRELCLGLYAMSTTTDHDAMVQFAFSLYDTDHSNAISPAELRDVLCLTRRLSGMLSNSDVDRLVRQFDRDRDGQISLDEFTKMTDQHPEVLDAVFQKLRPMLRESSSIMPASHKNSSRR